MHGKCVQLTAARVVFVDQVVGVDNVEAPAGIDGDAVDYARALRQRELAVERAGRFERLQPVVVMSVQLGPDQLRIGQVDSSPGTDRQVEVSAERSFCVAGDAPGAASRDRGGTDLGVTMAVLLGFDLDGGAGLGEFINVGVREARPFEFDRIGATGRAGHRDVAGADVRQRTERRLDAAEARSRSVLGNFPAFGCAERRAGGCESQAVGRARAFGGDDLALVDGQVAGAFGDRQSHVGPAGGGCFRQGHRPGADRDDLRLGRDAGAADFLALLEALAGGIDGGDRGGAGDEISAPRGAARNRAAPPGQEEFARRGELLHPEAVLGPVEETGVALVDDVDVVKGRAGRVVVDSDVAHTEELAGAAAHETLQAGGRAGLRLGGSIQDAPAEGELEVTFRAVDVDPAVTAVGYIEPAGFPVDSQALWSEGLAGAFAGFADRGVRRSGRRKGEDQENRDDGRRFAYGLHSRSPDLLSLPT